MKVLLHRESIWNRSLSPALSMDYSPKNQDFYENGLDCPLLWPLQRVPRKILYPNFQHSARTLTEDMCQFAQSTAERGTFPSLRGQRRLGPKVVRLLAEDCTPFLNARSWQKGQTRGLELTLPSL
jgi:hypothetical protein